MQAISHKFISGSPEVTGVRTGLLPVNVSATTCAAASNIIVIIISEDKFYIPLLFFPIPDKVRHKSKHAR